MDILIISILVIILGSAAYYVYREKKRGKKCIGCPSGGCCNQSKTSSTCNSCMNNGSQET